MICSPPVRLRLTRGSISARGGLSTTGGGRRWRGSRSAASSGCRSGRAGCSASWSSWPSPRSWRRSDSRSRSRRSRRAPPGGGGGAGVGVARERLAEPIEALEAGASAELVELGLWVAREYCSTPSRGLQLVLPPGTGSRRSGRTVRAKTELRAEILPAGEAALEGGGRLGVRQRAVLEALA